LVPPALRSGRAGSAFHPSEHLAASQAQAATTLVMGLVMPALVLLVLLPWFWFAAWWRVPLAVAAFLALRKAVAATTGSALHVLVSSIGV
jgi:hypothetical protein